MKTATEDKYAYRIIVNGSRPCAHAEYPSQQWDLVALTSDSRSVKATLERRLVTDSGIKAFFGGELPEGYLEFAGKVLCPWEVLAKIES